MANSYVVNHSQLQTLLEINLKANTVPFITGAPATGKSSVVKKIADKFNLALIDLRVTTLQPYDLTGLVKPYIKNIEGKEHHMATYAPIDTFPFEWTSLPINPETNKPYDGWLLFLDEFNSADKYMFAAAYKLILDRQIGDYKLHPKVRIVCAGNRITDGAIAHKIPTALQSRLTHLELDLDIKDWLEWLDTQTNWDSKVSSFLHFRKDYVINFNPNKEVVTFAAPRSWEMLSKQMQAGLGNLKKSELLPAVIGIVGEAAGQEFISYLEIFSKLPTIQEIENDPTNAKLPESIGGKWALGVFLSESINFQNENQIIKYLERIQESDLKVAAYRIIGQKHPLIRQNILFQQSMTAVKNQVI